MKKKYSCVAWDFNGTLLDDVAIGITAVNRLLERRLLPVIGSEEAYRELFDFPVIDYYKRLGFDFEKYPYNELAVEWVGEYLSLSHLATARKGAAEAVRTLAKSGIRQYIVSASKTDMLKKQLEPFGIAEYFEDIIGADNIHAYGKEEITRLWAESVPKDETVFIGDTVHDFDSATHAGVDCVLISGGHQTRAKLEGRTPNVIDSFEELVRIVLGEKNG